MVLALTSRLHDPAHGVRSSALKHISLRRNKITALNSVSLAIMIRDYPVASDHHIEVTATPNAASLVSEFTSDAEASPSSSSTLLPTPSSSAYIASDSISRAALFHAEREAWKNSDAHTKLKRQIDELPRTGSLLTLDVKGNDIRVSLTVVSSVSWMYSLNTTV